MSDNVIPIDAFSASMRHPEDWGPDATRPNTYAAGFFNIAQFSSVACGLTRGWVRRYGSGDEFPLRVREALERWVHENLRGVISVYISTRGTVRIEAKDEWAVFAYETKLNEAWLAKDFDAPTKK